MHKEHRYTVIPLYSPDNYQLKQQLIYKGLTETKLEMYSLYN